LPDTTKSTRLRLNSCAAEVATLGPGPAAGIWVQGCGLACSGCMSKETWAIDGGVEAEVGDVARWLNSTPLRHLTIAGGEPFDQAPALVELVDEARRDRDWVVTCYSGYYRRAIEREIRPRARDLLARLDLLIDGPYVAGLHAPLRWRGSTNQSLHLLTDRVTLDGDDVPAGMAVTFDEAGAFALIGVPPFPGFRAAFEDRIGDGGQPLSLPEGQGSFPFPVRRRH
jgi:anaerobic ribonucleoside-triphosphate reductase activating protein